MSSAELWEHCEAGRHNKSRIERRRRVWSYITSRWRRTSSRDRLLTPSVAGAAAAAGRGCDADVERERDRETERERVS